MEQLDILRLVFGVLEKLGVPHMLVGSMASSAYGEPRFTYDTDVLVDLRPSQIDSFCAAFPDPDFYLSRPSVIESVRSQLPFNLLHTESGNKVDFVFPPPNEWGRTQLQRRDRLEIFPNFDAFTAAPEDVIVGKMWYYSEGESPKHLRDILGMLQASQTKIDRDEIARWASLLGFSEIWETILNRLRGVE